MQVATTAKRLAIGTALALIALWAVSPALLAPKKAAEVAQPSSITDPNQQVLGTSIEGVVFQITSATATRAGIMVDQGQGFVLQAVDLPYVGRVDTDAPLIIVDATNNNAVLRCIIKQNDTILAANSRAGHVDCSALLTNRSAD